MGEGSKEKNGDSTRATVKLKNNMPVKAGLLFENSEWLTTAEAATYLRKFCPSGVPSVNAIHKLVSRGTIRRRKFAGRLYFKRKELDYLIECSGV